MVQLSPILKPRKRVCSAWNFKDHVHISRIESTAVSSYLSPSTAFKRNFLLGNFKYAKEYSWKCASIFVNSCTIVEAVSLISSPGYLVSRVFHEGESLILDYLSICTLLTYLFSLLRAYGIAYIYSTGPKVLSLLISSPPQKASRSRHVFNTVSHPEMPLRPYIFHILILVVRTAGITSKRHWATQLVHHTSLIFRGHG